MMMKYGRSRAHSVRRTRLSDLKERRLPRDTEKKTFLKLANRIKVANKFLSSSLKKNGTDKMCSMIESFILTNVIY
jgi:hypothetical protein